MQEFIESDPKENTPLVLHGIGKRTLLVNWMQKYKAESLKKDKDVIIPHFATIG
jgi:hypothetical protein